MATASLDSVKTEQDLKRLLEELITKYGQQFKFPSFTLEQKKKFAGFLSTTLPEWQSCLLPAATVVKVFGRDPSGADGIAAGTVPELLASCAGYSDSHALGASPEAKLEARRALCNLSFNSRLCREKLVALPNISSDLAEDACHRSSGESQLFCFKLLFILTAKDVKFREHVAKTEIECMVDYFTRTLSKETELSEGEMNILCEAFKVAFNMVHSFDSSSGDQKTLMDIVPFFYDFLLRQHAAPYDAKLKTEALSQMINFLTCAPSNTLSSLFPQKDLSNNELDPTAAALPEKYHGYDYRILVILLEYLSESLDSTETDTSSMCPVLTLLANGAFRCPHARKWLRYRVLPPLRDATKRPEEGNELRNKLVKLMGSGSVLATMSASFLFEVCSRNLERLIKYTGFGNAAGLVVERGLMAPGIAAETAVPDSDESDTEEYSQQRPDVNPVTGCVEADTANFFDGMTEEQKEYEAMKLVNVLHQMTSGSHGIRPARINADGKLEPVEHVLQMQQDAGLGSDEESE